MRHFFLAIWAFSFTSTVHAQTQASAQQQVVSPNLTKSSSASTTAPVSNGTAAASPASSTVGSEQPCAVPFTYIFTDSLGNMHKGLSSKDEKWFAEKVSKKYPEACYLQPEQWTNLARPTYVFFVNEHIEHGVTYDSQTRTSTQDVPVSGTVKDEYGETVGKVAGTASQTTTTQTVTPREITKHVDGLRLEAMQPDGSWRVFHVFPFQIRRKQEFFGLPVSQQRNLLEDAAKWIHEGGLTDWRQGAVQ
jgi:hypothetical protein